MIKAYQWLQSQSAEIRTLAMTPDLLISLYQKAQMQGKEALERPSLQNFKSELKNLAGMIGEFETPENNADVIHDPGAGAIHNPATMPPPHQSANHSTGRPMSDIPTGEAPSSAAGTAAAAAAAAAGPRVPPSASIPGQVIFPSPDHRPTGNFEALVLDSKSLEWLEEIQRELNLESTAEALRLALSVGYGRLSDLFPRRR